MKKLAILAVIVVVLLGAGSWLGDHYRYELYDAAMGFETDSAGLVKREMNTGKETFAFLEGPRVEGQESIIMLHGFSTHKANWMRFAKHFTSQYHVVALDLMGHGESQQDINQSFSIVAQLEFVRRVAASMGIERFHLVGNSMGGAISSLYAATYPDHVISATLISPAGVHEVPSKMDELLSSNGSNPLIASTVEEFADVIDFVMEDKPYIPGPVAKVEAERAVARAELNRKIFTDIRADLDLGLEQRFSDIKAPVLIMWGEQDRAINVQNIDKYASLIPNARKLRFEGVGHMAMIEIPGESARKMLDFLSKI